MNDCHPTDEVRAFKIRAQPIASQTPAWGPATAARDSGGWWWPIEPCQLPMGGASYSSGAGIPGMSVALSRMVPRSSLL